MERGGHPGVQGAAVVGEAQPVQPPVPRIPFADQQSLAFHFRGQPADGALLQAQPIGKVALGQRRVGVQFVQREGLRHGQWLSGYGLVRLQQTGCPDEVHEQLVEPLRGRQVHIGRSAGGSRRRRVVCCNFPAYGGHGCRVQL